NDLDILEPPQEVSPCGPPRRHRRGVTLRPFGSGECTPPRSAWSCISTRPATVIRPRLRSLHSDPPWNMFLRKMAFELYAFRTDPERLDSSEGGGPRPDRRNDLAPPDLAAEPSPDAALAVIARGEDHRQVELGDHHEHLTTVAGRRVATELAAAGPQ